MIFKVPLKPNHSVVLWFYPWALSFCVTEMFAGACTAPAHCRGFVPTFINSFLIKGHKFFTQSPKKNPQLLSQQSAVSLG